MPGGKAFHEYSLDGSERRATCRCSVSGQHVTLPKLKRQFESGLLLQVIPNVLYFGIMNDKFCPKCVTTKPIDDFAIRIRNGKEIRQAMCRSCHSRYRKNHYGQNRQKYIDKAKQNTLSYRTTMQQIVKDHLLCHPCVDCGESDLIVLEFDHVRGTKSFNISWYVSQGRSTRVDLLREEIDKCEVRCANCHRRVTHARRLTAY